MCLFYACSLVCSFQKALLHRLPWQQHMCSLLSVCPSFSLSSSPSFPITPPSSIFGLPFTQWHLLPWGLTTDKRREMLILQTVIWNRDAWPSIANGLVGFVRKQINALNWYLTLNASVISASLYSHVPVHMSIFFSMFEVSDNLPQNGAYYAKQVLILHFDPDYHP